MAKGKKRSKSLLELMDPKGGYRAPLGTSTLASKSAEPTKSKKTTKKESAKKPAPTKEPPKEEETEYGAQPLLAFDDGKMRLRLGYPLAVMIGFIVVVAIICAVLIGWKLGRDRTDEKWRAAFSGQPEKIDRNIPGMDLDSSAKSLDQ